jgi:hypothetical protein
MLIALLLAAAAANAAPHRGEALEPPEFRAASERFTDASSCRTHLGRLIAEARASGFDAAEGPYELAAGDVRAHTVRAEGHGHVIAEYRCAGAELGERRWTRSMASGGGAEEEFTVESVARRAEWLKHARGQQH